MAKASLLSVERLAAIRALHRDRYQETPEDADVDLDAAIDLLDAMPEMFDEIDRLRVAAPPHSVVEAAHRILSRLQPEIDPGDAELIAGWVIEQKP